MAVGGEATTAAKTWRKSAPLGVLNPSLANKLRPGKKRLYLRAACRGSRRQRL